MGNLRSSPSGGGFQLRQFYITAATAVAVPAMQVDPFEWASWDLLSLNRPFELQLLNQLQADSVPTGTPGSLVTDVYAVDADGDDIGSAIFNFTLTLAAAVGNTRVRMDVPAAAQRLSFRSVNALGVPVDIVAGALWGSYLAKDT